jgi:osmotically-inducible protein OsmY
MQIIKTFSAATLACLILAAGCADKNKNGQPDSVAPGAAAQADKMAGEAAGAAKKAAGEAATAATNALDAATVTPAVKTALGQNAALKGSKIDVDTLGTKDTVALRGTVKSEAQKKLAEAIAKKNAPHYKIANQLKVTGK